MIELEKIQKIVCNYLDEQMGRNSYYVNLTDEILLLNPSYRNRTRGAAVIVSPRCSYSKFAILCYSTVDGTYRMKFYNMFGNKVKITLNGLMRCCKEFPLYYKRMNMNKRIKELEKDF